MMRCMRSAFARIRSPRRVAAASPSAWRSRSCAEVVMAEERIAQIVADDPEHVPLELLRLTLGGDRGRGCRARGSRRRSAPGTSSRPSGATGPGAGVSPESSTSSWLLTASRSGSRLHRIVRQVRQQLARGAADVRLRRDAVHLGEHRVHAREAQVAIDKPDPERRVVEDRVEDCARPLLAGARGPLGVEQAGDRAPARTAARWRS